MFFIQSYSISSYTNPILCYELVLAAQVVEQQDQAVVGSFDSTF